MLAVLLTAGRLVCMRRSYRAKLMDSVHTEAAPVLAELGRGAGRGPPQARRIGSSMSRERARCSAKHTRLAREEELEVVAADTTAAEHMPAAHEDSLEHFEL